MQIKDIELVQTCGACPEQYDAFLGGKMVGYLRLRHGYFYVSYPYVGGETVYEAYPDGDGCFDSEEERGYHLRNAKHAIIEKINNSKINDMETHDTVLVGWDKITKEVVHFKSFNYKGSEGDKKQAQLELQNLQDAGHIWQIGSVDTFMSKVCNFEEINDEISLLLDKIRSDDK